MAQGRISEDLEMRLLVVCNFCFIVEVVCHLKSLRNKVLEGFLTKRYIEMAQINVICSDPLALLLLHNSANLKYLYNTILFLFNFYLVSLIFPKYVTNI